MKNNTKGTLSSSSNSNTSGTGRFSIFDSAVTPFFASVKSDSEKKQPFSIAESYLEGQNTQQCIQRLVEQNQNGNGMGFGNDGFGFGFSFAGGNQGNNGDQYFDQQGQNGFEQEFDFGQNLNQSPDFFQPEVNNSHFSTSFASSFGNTTKFNQSSQHSLQETQTNHHQHNFMEFYTFQHDTEAFESEKKINSNSPKKRSRTDDFLNEKKDIIYEVESKFQYEGTTSPIPSQSLAIVSHRTQSGQKSVQIENDVEIDKIEHVSEKKGLQFQQLRQSIIKELSQMDSDQWEEKDNDFRQNSQLQKPPHNILKGSLAIRKSSEIQNASPEKKNFNESIIQKLFSQKKANVTVQEKPYPKIDIPKTSRSFNLFRVRSKQKPLEEKNDQQKKSINPYSEQKSITPKIDSKIGSNQKRNFHTQESDVEEINFQKPQTLINLKKTLEMNKQKKINQQMAINIFSNQKQTNQTVQRATEDPPQGLHQNKRDEFEKNTFPETFKKAQQKIEQKRQPEPIRKRQPLQFRPRHRLNYKPEVIDESEQFQVQQRPLSNRNQFLSKNIDFSSEMDTKPIENYQSAGKQKQIDKIPSNRNALNRLLQDQKSTSKKSFNQNKMSWIDREINKKQVQQLNIESKSRKINFAKRQPVIDNQQKQETKVETIKNKEPQKRPNRRLEWNFTRKNRRLEDLSIDKSQKASETSSKQSISSDGIKIDTKGFMDKVLSNTNENERLTKNQSNYSEMEKPALNMRRLNRFSSLFGKEQNKEKKAQKEKEQPKINQTTNLFKQQRNQHTPRPQRKLDFQNEQKKQSINHLDYKLKHPSFQNDTTNFHDKQENLRQKLDKLSELQIKREKNNYFLPKITFSKRTPAKEPPKNQKQGRTFSFSTQKASKFTSNQQQQDIEVLRQNSVSSYQTINPNNNQRENYHITPSQKKHIPFSERDPNNLFDLPESYIRRRDSFTPSFPSSDSQKSMQFFNEVMDLMQALDKKKRQFDRLKRQRQQQLRVIRSLNRRVEQRFSQQKLKEMMYWKYNDDDESWW